MISAAEECGFELQMNGRLAQKITAVLQDLQSKRLFVGDIKLVLDDYIPGGIQAGDTIEFECARIDVW